MSQIPCYSGPMNLSGGPKLVSKYADEYDTKSDRKHIDAVSHAEPLPTPPVEIYLVFDTNFFISNLPLIECTVEMAPYYHFLVVIPKYVVHELDALKSGSKGKLARDANAWLYNQLANNSRVLRIQNREECIDLTLTKDDAIHDCCLYLKNHYKLLVVLFSNDRNLCIKALGDSILTVSYVPGLTARFIAENIYRESMTENGIDIDLDEPQYAPQRTGNPYIEMGDKVFLKQVFLDAEQLLASRFQEFFAAFGQNQLIGGIAGLVDAIKAEWGQWKFEEVFGPRPNLHPTYKYVSPFDYMGLVCLDIKGSPRLSLVQDTKDGERTIVWQISPAQERVILSQPPETLYQMKKFYSFWGLILVKLTLFLDQVHNRRSVEELDKILGLWSDAFDEFVDRDWVVGVEKS